MTKLKSTAFVAMRLKDDPNCEYAMSVPDRDSENYLGAIHNAAFDFVDFPCEVTEVECIARTALNYFQGQSQPDTRGEGCIPAVQELPGTKGS